MKKQKGTWEFYGGGFSTPLIPIDEADAATDEDKPPAKELKPAHPKRRLQVVAAIVHQLQQNGQLAKLTPRYIMEGFQRAGIACCYSTGLKYTHMFAQREAGAWVVAASERPRLLKRRPKGGVQIKEVSGTLGRVERARFLSPADARQVGYALLAGKDVKLSTPTVHKYR